MIIKGISVRSNLLLATLATLVLLVALLLGFMDASDRISRERELVNARSEMLFEMLSLNRSFEKLVIGEEPGMAAACLEHLRSLESGVSQLKVHEILAGDQQVTLKAGQVQATLERLVNDLQFSPGEEPGRWLQATTGMVVLGKLVEEFDRSVDLHQDRAVRRGLHQLTMILALGIFLIGTCLVLFAAGLSRSFRKLIAFAGELKTGKVPLPLDSFSRDEFGQLAGDLNTHAAELQSKIRYISSLSEEGPVELYTPGEEDELGNALVVLANYLSRKELDEVTRNREDKKQNWISEGVAQLGEVLRSERENVVELSYSIIQKLVTYMNVEMGSLFIINSSDPGNLFLELAASYAYDRRKYRNRTLAWGEGLPGACAQEKKRIFLTEVPDDYFEISSGTGAAKPNCLLLVPMMIKEKVYGVVELATVRLLRPFEIEFVESLAVSISSSLLAVRTNERTSELLKQSQAQAEALKSQEAAMMENLNKLEEAQSESSRKESEITGILNAINQSTLVAELGLNGRFTSINDRFLLLLESQRDQVLGKLHSEFAQVDPYADEYKGFWASLREGQSISNTERYRLFSGKEVWLQQTFTPLVNNEGHVHKILNIAVDITETRMLQEQLESRDLEITRRNLDMQTLNEAVNSALIKCELDAEGIIMEVNEKYTEVSGYGRKELLGRNYRLFLKDSEKEQFEKIWEEVTKQKVYEGVVRRSRPTGEEVWLVSTFSPVIDEAGVIYKVYYMGLDITEKKLKYQLLEDANQEIERLRERLKDYET
jgi:PAS domain S-box-containing protein